MRLSSIALTLMVATSCATGEADPYEIPPLDAGKSDGKGAGGKGGSGATGGSGGSGATGGSATGGSGGSGATGGTGGSGGSGATGGTGGAGGKGGSGGSSGSAGRGGSGGTGGGTGGTGGSGGSSADAGVGCPGTADWMMGGTYAQGDKVRAVCSSASGGMGPTCTVGKSYTWACNLGVACGLVAPGAANWGLAWLLGAECI
jgi:hypothetical protein